MNDDLRRAIEEIKLRTPIEDLVRERVPSLKKRGRLWWACCPFHEERTPSFTVDPTRGTWRCYGACGTGGDSIQFVERSQNVDFMEALRSLATRAGVVLPDRRTERDRAEDAERAELYTVLERANDFYRRALHTEAGARALAYLRERGLAANTIDAFGVGYAPAGGEVLVKRAVSAGVPDEHLIRSGLARRDERGRVYDFFRDRLMIPIRDLKGRTVGFGGRRLSDDDVRVPKYVNTQETEVFHKGRVIYALDLALEHVRKLGHLILVEGYTDVMAAHQVGLRTVVAVLGTATTDEHASLVRRTGARRVSLCFDGDDAGRKATYKALTGLLSLELAIDVVRIPGDEDPCDLLVREGATALDSMLATATPWFEFVLSGFDALPPTERARSVDPVLELIARLPRALDRDAHLSVVAERLDFPLESVRQQFESLPERQRERQKKARESQAAAEAPRAIVVRPDPELERAQRSFGELAALAMIEPALAPKLEPWLAVCPACDERRLIEIVVALGAEGSLSIQRVLTELTDEPARNLVLPLLDWVERSELVREVYFEELTRSISRWNERRRIETGRRALGRGDDENVMAELHPAFRRIKVPQEPR